ncbi:Hsp20 family protein [Coralloluteibacterium stylophorae]|uniref:Hsp20 family protein n=1 Tax=Coralloluteibacterium stylophorae TaxID=1776034 RepID=A0A8J7VS87_9GAMM|nr:Hsp20 family protein [Coralloluteibacterium stylophorae]MBS7456919.1 Hsp20 family protein [Coralloluteibacterium stylophorae]
MRTAFDFAPLHRASIGFDHVFDLLENAARGQAPDNWPPFDTVRLDDDAYRITMAVAGFRREEIDVTVEGNLLVISGEHADAPQGEFLHRGIAYRPFNRRFELADHVRVVSATLADGLLTVELKREIPEAMKPRRIAIDAPAPQADNVRRIEDQAA